MEPAFVHSPRYDYALPEMGPADQLASLHRFDGKRASRAWALFEEVGGAPAGTRLEPAPVERADLLLAHDAAYLDSLTSSEALAEIIEIPEAALVPFDLLEAILLEPMRHATGGTILALREAFERGLVVNLSGGYHHAKRDRGEGFCAFSDLAVAIGVARRERGPLRALVVDLDAHQGNGVASIFARDDDAAVFDVYNGEIWPQDEVARRAIRWDHPLPSGTDGAAYLELLARELPRALDEFEPQLVMYNAGTDIVAGDPLGLFEVSTEDVLRRDLFVLEETARRGLPTVVTPSGGYTETSHQLLAELLIEVRERWLRA